MPPEVLVSINQIEEPSKLADTVAAHLSLKIPEKQELLEAVSAEDGWSACSLSWKARSSSGGREAHPWPREAPDGADPARVLSERTDEGDSARTRRAKTSKMTSCRARGEAFKSQSSPRKPRRKSQAELKKLRNMSPMSAEATVVRNYLDWMTSIPWKKPSRVKTRSEGCGSSPECRPLWPGEGQRTHPRIPRRADAYAEGQRPNSLPRWPAGRW